MDALYVLGGGSPYQNKELLFSVRTLRKYAPFIDNIYVVGDAPGQELGPNVYHIPDTDRGRNKEENIMLKVLGACDLPQLSNRFMFVNDDHFFTAPVPPDLPNFYESNLVRAFLNKRKNGAYKISLENTYMQLCLKDLPIKNFDIHVPIIYAKNAFQHVMGQYNWNRKFGYVVKSLFANTMQLKGAPLEDLKIVDQYLTVPEIRARVGGRWVFSTDDNAMNDAMWQYLSEV